MSALSINDKWERLSEEQRKTVEDAREKMNMAGKVIMIRPTGFGKTKILVEDMAKHYIKTKKKKVAYLYPLDIIRVEIESPVKKIKADGTLVKQPNKYMRDKVLKTCKFSEMDKHPESNMVFISYNELTEKFNKFGLDYWRNVFKDDFSLIILDEVHRAGSEKFADVYDTISDLINADGIHMIGATATPNRMDDDDEDKPPVIDRIFDGIGVYQYDLGDALRDGLINELILQVSIYQMDALFEDLKKLNKKKYGKEFNESSFNIEIGKLRRTIGTEGEYIYNALPQAGYDLKKDKYYKFIVFFVNIQDMVDRGPEVEEWFNKAFNKVAKERNFLKRDFNIKSHYIASKDTEDGGLDKLIAEKSNNRQFFKNTKKVENIIEEEYAVDLLMTVDKINMGYHVENITGIMMLRGTKSEIVYYQQLGRALSVSAIHNPIVYDMTNNYKEKFGLKIIVIRE